MEFTDDPITHADEPLPEPPPLPPGLTPGEAFIGQSIAWSGRNQIGEIRTARRDNRRDHRAVLGKLDEIRAGLAGVDKDLDEIKAKPEPVGPLARMLAWIDGMPAVKNAISIALASFIGVGASMLIAYMSLRATGGIASPAQIVSAAEAPQPAPVTVITSATTAAPVEPPAPAAEPEAAPVAPGAAMGGHGDGNPMHDQPHE